LGDGIGRDFLDRGPDRRFIPDIMCKRTMTSGGNHAASLLNAMRHRIVDRWRIVVNMAALSAPAQYRWRSVHRIDQWVRKTSREKDGGRRIVARSKGG
jgi:hypothetical protein